MPDLNPSLKLSPEIQGASSIFDLQIENKVDYKNYGLGVTALNILALKFVENAVEENFQKEMLQIQNNILDSIQNPNTGYLLELVIFSHTDGTIYLPQGRIINPIGIGTEPLDAMANYLTQDNLIPGKSAPLYLKNNSSFLWITKKGDSAIAQTIPTSFYNNFRQLSQNEATKRKLMGQWIQMNTEDHLKSIKIAEFWVKFNKDKIIAIQNEETKKTIENLTKKMQELQKETNILYQNYQKIQEEMVINQKYYNTLNTISSVANLISKGIELKQTLSSQNKSLKNGSDDFLMNLEETKTQTNSKLSNLGLINESYTTKINTSLTEMGTIQNTLTTIYNIEMIPVQKLDSNPKLQ